MAASFGRPFILSLLLAATLFAWYLSHNPRFNLPAVRRISDTDLALSFPTTLDFITHNGLPPRRLLRPRCLLEGQERFRYMLNGDGETAGFIFDPCFLNRISNTYQSEEPPQRYGGIVADPMGLGKTLTMISLAATDLDRNNSDCCAI